MQDVPDWHRADSDTFEAEGEGELYEFGQVQCQQCPPCAYPLAKQLYRLLKALAQAFAFHLSSKPLVIA